MNLNAQLAEKEWMTFRRSKFWVVLAILSLSVLGVLSATLRAPKRSPATVPQSAGFSIESIPQLIQNITTLEEFIPLLPESLRKEYVLMYRSRSIQKATFANPRAILYGPNAHLVVAFEGERSPSGSDTVEFMQYRESEKSFEFYELTFNPALGSPRLSPKNPQRCLECHRSPDPRPNWEPYNLWAGAYGSKGDFPSAEERLHLNAYIEKAATHPRYRHLDPDFFKIESEHQRFENTPNVRFTQMLSVLNMPRVARLIRRTPHFQEFKYAYLQPLLCEKAPSFLPEHLATLRPPKKTPTIAADPEFSGTSRDEWKINYWPLRHIFEGRGLLTQDWYMNFEISWKNTLSSPFKSPMELAGALIAEDPELRELIPIVTRGLHVDIVIADDSKEFPCAEMRARSLRNLARYRLPREKNAAVALRRQEVRGRGEPLRICATCHEVRGILNHYRDNPDFAREVKTRIDPKATPSWRMPPQRTLSDEERDSIESFLDLISSGR